ncbi:hypothetical protein P3S68_015190 [Capsicum galapagoense]
MDNSNSGQESGQNSGSSRRTRSQTGLVVVKEGEEVGRKKSLNFVGKKSRVYGKNHVKDSKKRKRLKNVNVGVVGFPKRRKVNDDDAEGKAKKSRDLEIGSSIVRPKKRYRPRVGAQTNVEAVNMLKEKLDAKQIQMFRETCFGRFLDLPPVVVQHQLAHSLLLREVVEEKDDALWISVKDVKLRFGLVEFGIITGLKCTGDAYKCCDSDGMGQLINTYFPSEQSRVAKQSLIDCINDKRFKSDEDAVKLAVLYFIHTFLFSTVKHKHITRDDFELVESGAYETYPWGKAVFKAIMKAMKGKLQGKPSFYRLGGLPLAFQCWFYECCPYVNNKIAFRVDDKVPRILSWKVTKQPTFKELWDVIFRQKQDQLKLRNISPTEFEKATLDLPESIDDERVNEVASRDIAEVHMAEVHIAQDFSSPPPRASRKQLKTKRNPALNNDDDWSTELKRLSDGQSELKCEIQMLNNELASLNDCMRTSFANVFKAIESLSKKQGEKTASELDGANDPHDRHGESNSSEFSNSDDNGSEGQEQGSDKDINEKANEAATGDVEGEDKLGDPMKEVERMDIYEAQILPDTCEVSVHFTPEQLTKPSDLAPVPESPQVNQDDAGIEGSSKKSSDVDNVDYSLLTEFDKWVDEGMKKQSK